MCSGECLYLKLKSEEDSDEIFEDEARHIRKVVLCVLLEEWRAVLGKVAEDPMIPSAECLEDFPLPEHQNIRKAVLCVLPKEFCV